MSVTTVGPAVTVERDCPMTTRDGVTLRADVYRPEEAERECPVLLMRTPYDKQWAHDGSYLHPVWYVRQGFIVVVQDTRGRYASDGDFAPFVHEPEDGYDTVEWAAALDGSNGRVGMYGSSYAGAVQLLAAVEGPPHLGGIAPAVTSADFHTRWTYEGGALHLAFVATWAATLADNIAVRRADMAMVGRLREAIAAGGTWLHSAAPADLEPLAEAAPFYLDWLEHAADEDFWSSRSASSRLDRVGVPALHIAGWYDIFLEGSLDAYRALSARENAPEQALIVGPWFHYPWGDLVGDVRFPLGAGTHLLDRAQVDFFRRHLLGDGVGDVPPVRFYVLFGEGWRQTGSWPPPESTAVSYYLSSEGGANTAGGDGRLSLDQPADSEPCDVYQYYPPYPVPALGGHSCCESSLVPMGCRDQTTIEAMPEVLVYTSEPSERELTFGGPAEAVLHVTTEAASADYTAKVCVVDERGSWNVAEGIQRLGQDELERLRDSAGLIRVVVSLRSTAFRLAAGQRLRLEVSSGAFPTYDRNPQTGDPPATTPIDQAVGAMHSVFHEPGRASRLVLHLLAEAG
jgi:uncharacterized protein